tara:strand:+ start:130 stop:951 length:822 start_codon:yes stop_codon:yes gene_type:complete
MASIYIIQHKETGKKYVGKTVKEPHVRWQQHKQMGRSYNNLAEGNSNKSMPIVRALNKHGEDAFTFYVIETVDDENVNERERYWIEKFDTYTNGYNSTYGGEGCIRDQSTLKHINMKPVDCYTLEGEYIETIRSVGYAAKCKEINSKGSIVACIKGTTFQAGGYRWTWKDGELADVNPRVNRRGNVYAINIYGETKSFKSQADCTEFIEGNRKNNNGVFQSLNSPASNKLQIKGWYVFRDEKEMDSFTPAQRNKFDSFTGRIAGAKGNKTMGR